MTSKRHFIFLFFLCIQKRVPQVPSSPYPSRVPTKHVTSATESDLSAAAASLRAVQQKRRCLDDNLRTVQSQRQLYSGDACEEMDAEKLRISSLVDSHIARIQMDQEVWRI